MKTGRVIALLLGYVLLLWWLPHSQATFAAWFPNLSEPLYQRQSFLSLTLSHLQLVAAASAMCIFLALGAGIFVTRKVGEDFLPLASALSTIGQTFPPAAVLAISVPLIGFGFWPAWLALVLYGILPILENTISGLRGVSPTVKEAALGMGMTVWQRFWQVEWPLALPVILAGIRSSLMITMATATIGSTVGAQTLGTPIIAGLVNQNPAYILQGAILVAWLALLLDQSIDWLESHWIKRAKTA